MGYITSRERHLKMPKKEAIYEYWEYEDRLPPRKDGNKWYNNVAITCFACGALTILHRCHIIPSCLGGDNSVENLHLLCRGCHEFSENNKHYWNWLSYMRLHEWKDLIEWTWKILKMNGVDTDPWIERFNKVQKMSKKEQNIFMKDFEDLINNHKLKMDCKG